LAELPESVVRRTVGVRDIPLALLAPRRLFARVEDVAAWGWPLAVLLAVVTLIGYATVETGLIDREVDRAVDERIRQIDSQQRDVVERSTLRELYDNEHKQGEFTKLLKRMQVILAEPLTALAAALLVAALLYGVTALTGRKPEWHTLLTICVFAGFVDALRLLVMLALRLSYRSLEVDTSLSLLTGLLTDQRGLSPTTLAVVSGLLTALDPFRIWYWLVVIVGLAVTSQLPGWRAWLTCGLSWLVAAGGRCGLEVAMLPGTLGGGPPGG
jgi:hypothetical protein